LANTVPIEPFVQIPIAAPPVIAPALWANEMFVTPPKHLAQGTSDATHDSLGDPSSDRYLLSWPEPVLFPIRVSSYLSKSQTHPYELLVDQPHRLSLSIRVRDETTPDSILERTKPMLELVHLPYSSQQQEKRILAIDLMLDRSAHLTCDQVSVSAKDRLWIRISRRESARYSVQCMATVF
jgi:hypothetical protein